MSRFHALFNWYRSRFYDNKKKGKKKFSSKKEKEKYDSLNISLEWYIMKLSASCLFVLDFLSSFYQETMEFRIDSHANKE